MHLNSECTLGTHDQPSTQLPQHVFEMISSRHSTRAFLQQPLRQSVIEHVLTAAQRAPSNSNLQPWRVKVVTGKALQRLTSALSAAFWTDTPTTTKPIPESYHKYRSALGKQLYGPEGYNVPRGDEERTRKMRVRNYQFFDAPCAMIVCMEKGLSEIDILSIGMYVQAVCLMLAEQGIATCAEASVAGYPQVCGPCVSLVIITSS
jgi:nitroreductase